MRLIICLCALALSSSAFAQGLPDLEEKVRILTERVDQLVDDVDEIKNGKNILHYKSIPVGELKPNKKKTYSFTTNKASVLVSTLYTRVKPKKYKVQHTIESKSFISVNGELCAYDQSAYFVWSGHAASNATCIVELEAGTHEIEFHPSPAFWPKKVVVGFDGLKPKYGNLVHPSDAWARFTVLRK